MTCVGKSLRQKFLLKRIKHRASGRYFWKPRKAVKASEDLLLLCFYLSWIENFIWIRDKEGKIVPFHFNPTQRILAQWTAIQIHNKVPPRAWTPKSRQMGSSTYWDLLFLALCCHRPGYRVATVAHDEAGAQAVFSRTLTAVRQLKKHGEEVPSLIQEQNGYILWESESSKQAATIKTGDAALKGVSLNALHSSETANFSDRGHDGQKALNSILPAINETDVWSFIIHESTAKGKDPIFWRGCEDARDPESGSTFGLIFLPWLLDDTYKMSWAEYRRRLMLSGKPDPGVSFEPTEEEDLLRRKLANVQVREGEEWYRWRIDVSDQQLIWRRWAIVNKCHGSIEEFKRYYPSFYEEAFTASTACLFDDATIDWYRQNGKEPIAKGHMHDVHGGAAFQQHQRGLLSIWEFPQPHSEYVLSCDPGGEKKKSDPYNGYVIDKHALKVVAAIHGKFEWDEFADQAFLLGLFYNEALLVGENNVQPAIVKRWHRMRYPNLYYYFEPDTSKQREGKAPGFNTNRKTRPQIEKVLEQLCRSKRVVNPDPDFWKEMESFVWVPKPHAANPSVDGNYKATGGNHDDRLMSLGIGLLQCPRPEGVLNVPKFVEAESAAIRFLREAQERKKQMEREGRPGFFYLGATRAA